jgi:hypothetical protein
MRTRNLVAGLVLVAFAVIGTLMSQGLTQSGGPGSTVTANAGTNLNTSALALESGGNLATIAGAISAGKINVTGTIGAVTSITNALPAGANLIGFTMQMPAGCSGSGTALVPHNVVGVATSAGTSVSSVTGCVVECYVNNITSSAVTLRIADKTGTPIIWVGGGTDFSIPAISNVGCAGNNGVNLAGIIMASGITAIAGTGSALNLHILTRE